MALHLLRRIHEVLDTADDQGNDGPPGTTVANQEVDAATAEVDVDEAQKEAEEASKILRAAAVVAESLAPKYKEALCKANAAEAEVIRLRAALAEAEAKIASMQEQQLRVTEGLVGEVRQRDAEIASLRAAAAASTASFSSTASAPTTSTTGPVSSNTEGGLEVITVTTEESLDITFDRDNACIKVVASVSSQSPVSGRLQSGDEVISIGGTSARNLSWEEFDEALKVRPLVMSVRRDDPDSEANAGLRTIRFANRVRNLAGWTRAAVKAAAGEFEAVLSDVQDSASAPVNPGVKASKDEEDDTGDMEARNQPFYDLVRRSMEAACAREDNKQDEQNSQAFEQWLQQFHNDRDSEWYANNHTRAMRLEFNSSLTAAVT